MTDEKSSSDDSLLIQKTMNSLRRVVSEFPEAQRVLGLELMLVALIQLLQMRRGNVYMVGFMGGVLNDLLNQLDTDTKRMH